MRKEEKNIDFYTTGRQPSDEDFSRISEWISDNKQQKKKASAKQISRCNPRVKKAVK